MTTLRFGLQGLPLAEAGLIRTLFRLYAHGTNDFRWSVVTAPPYDAVLVDTTTGAPHSNDIDPSVTAMLKLADSVPADSQDAIERPIRSEILEAWLLKIQKQRLEKSVTTSLAATRQSIFTEMDASSVKFKLMRWPSAMLLRNDPHLVRMATLLSRRAMSVTELTALTNFPQGRVQNFFNILKASMLLKEESSSLQPRALTVQAKHKKPNAPRGLVSRIRLRLGI